MSATDKTKYLGLCSYILSDCPQMSDINADHEIIDNAVKAHFTDTESHITKSEREAWNSPAFCGRYIGNGEAERTVDTACPFNASAVIVFAADEVPFSADFDAKEASVKFALCAGMFASAGIALDGAKIKVSQSKAAEGGVLTSLNENGAVYAFVMVR